MRLIGNACLLCECICAWLIKLTRAICRAETSRSRLSNTCALPPAMGARPNIYIYIYVGMVRRQRQRQHKNKLNVTVDGMPFVCCATRWSGHTNVKFTLKKISAKKYFHMRESTSSTGGCRRSAIQETIHSCMCVCVDASVLLHSSKGT